MLTDKELRDAIKKAKGSRKVYVPLKYFRGLKFKKQVKERVEKILLKNYRPFKTDEGVKTRTSSFTKRFMKKYPNAKSLNEKAKATGVPLNIIQRVYNKGLAAWRTGHRPGATGQQWGYARVHSFLMKGPTFHGPDRHLAREAGMVKN